jgi:hypothetical protein
MTSNVPGIVISQTNDGPASLQAKYCHQNSSVHSKSSQFTPVEHTTTIKQLLSKLINWTHFPKLLGAPVTDQDRNAQVASFCTVAPNICQSSVCYIFHATLLTPDILRKITDFLKIYIYHIPVMPEHRGMGKGQCIHTITGTGGRLRDKAILFLDVGIRWGRADILLSSHSP